MMDRCIHKGEGGNHSEVEDESEEGGSRIEREREREWENEEGDGRTLNLQKGLLGFFT